MEPQQNFFQRKAASEAAICEIVKMLAEDFNCSVSINVSVESADKSMAGKILFQNPPVPKITTIIN